MDGICRYFYYANILSEGEAAQNYASDFMDRMHSDHIAHQSTLSQQVKKHMGIKATKNSQRFSSFASIDQAVFTLGLSVLVELVNLGGRSKLKFPVESLITF